MDRVPQQLRVLRRACRLGARLGGEARSFSLQDDRIMRDAALSALATPTTIDARVFGSPGPSAKHAEPAVNPHFVVARDGYHVRLANPNGALRSQISRLIERMYAWRGLHSYHGEIPTRAGQTTIVACSGDRLFGTLSVGLDTGNGLLADTLYRNELDAMRAEGARVCEVTRLAMDPAFSSHEVMATIFNLVFILARRVFDMTDVVIEVNPRHVGFYRRMLGYRVAGPELTCPRVGAPAVLMQLSLEHAARMIREYAGRATEAGRSLYRQFLTPEEEARVLGQLLEAPLAA
jgi:hypothetical protein